MDGVALEDKITYLRFHHERLVKTENASKELFHGDSVEYSDDDGDLEKYLANFQRM